MTEVRNGHRRRSAAAGATRRRPAATPRRQAWRSLTLLDGWVNRLLILVGAGMVVLAGLQGYIALQELPVERIVVSGKLQRIQTEAVRELVQPALVGGFLSADLDQIRRQLQTLPWIYTVSVRRRWPNALEIEVVEQLPIARWGEGGFINHEGEVFQSNREGGSEALPRLEGPPGSARELIVSYQQLSELLQPLELELRELTLDERGQLSVLLHGGIELVLGNTQLVERVQRFAAVYGAELAPRADQLQRVDLRYENGFAVTFREPAQLAVIANE